MNRTVSTYAIKVAFCLLFTVWSLVACTPVKMPVSKQYELDAFSALTRPYKHSKISILVSQPEAMAGNQTEQMHYVQHPYELSSFVHNTWISAPANMLYPLIVQSLQKTGYFHAVASGPYTDRADYRLDAQLITLYQDFTKRPSVVVFVAKIMLTHIEDNRLISSQIITEKVACSSDTPYGGVLAANKATAQFTATLSQFVVTHISQDKPLAYLKKNQILLSNSQNLKTIVQ